MRRPTAIVLCCLAAAALATGLSPAIRNGAWAVYTRLRGRATVEDRLGEFGAAARARLGPGFEAAGIAYPPKGATFVILKEERRVEVYARSGGPWHLVRTLPIEGASGTAGPKLREGDGQVPEGRYRVESLHPNSRFHAALRVAYPSEADQAWARADGRTELGDDIMVHGGRASIGCVAMGDPGIEELFTLAADTGPERVELLILPCDLGRSDHPPLPSSPAWVGELYAQLAERLRELASEAPQPR
jgi:hypothetical protein